MNLFGRKINNLFAPDEEIMNVFESIKIENHKKFCEILPEDCLNLNFDCII